jgi:Virulence-associated protein E-like domain/Primase C terminal 2 (PriCT-2)
MENNNILTFKDYYDLYTSLEFKPVKCKGYHQKHNPRGIYDVAKEPIEKAWQSKHPTLEECQHLLDESGWIGWLIPKGLIVLDIDANKNTSEEEYQEKMRRIDNYLGSIGILPPKHKTQNGYHLFFRCDGRNFHGKETAIGVKVTYRYGVGEDGIGTNQLILAPSNNRKWEIPLPLTTDEIPIIPPGLMPAKVDTNRDGDNFQKIINAQRALSKLKQWRVEDYDSWIHVGMCLRELGPEGLKMWDDWSKKSDKYRPGSCFDKWQTFAPGGDGDTLSLKTLFYWASQDAAEIVIPECPKRAIPATYRRVLELLGYSFRLNLMDDSIWFGGVNIDVGMEQGRMMSDILLGCIEYEIGNYQYKNYRIIWNCILKMASESAFHPVRDYLNPLVWDGEDHIEKLCSYFQTEDEFQKYLTKWLVGAVAKAYAGPNGVEAVWLVMDGDQNIGKSYFCQWLCKALPNMFIEDIYNPENKDDKIRMLQKWIWEVKEIKSTIRKTDHETLKGSITQKVVSVRKPYGKSDTTKPVLSSYIGTLNDDGTGFLNDYTGTRRYMTVKILKIDFGYSGTGGVDVNQLWAQAKQLYNNGFKWELSNDEIAELNKTNGRYEIGDPIEDAILRYFDVDETRTDLSKDFMFTPTCAILERLRSFGYFQRMDNSDNMRLSQVLKKLKCKKDHISQDGVRSRGWLGIRPNFLTPDDS